MEKHTVTYGNKTIEYQLIRKNVKNINLKVKPDLQVIVSAGDKVPSDYIKEFVKAKAPWIIKHSKSFQETRPEVTEREYVNGETVRYLGKQYRLRVEQAEKEEAKFYQGRIYLYVKDGSDLKKKDSLYNKWLREKAKEVFNESLERMYPKLKKYGVEKPDIMVRVMKTRWGSCSRNKQRINLNLALIKAPKSCIDYVVLHELVHFKHRNHNKDFYNFLTALMPDWKKRKALLDSEIVLEL